MDAGRIQKELKEIERDKASGVTVVTKGSSLNSLVGIVDCLRLVQLHSSVPALGDAAKRCESLR